MGIAELATLQRWVCFNKGVIAGEEMRDTLVTEERDSAVLKSAELTRQLLEEKEDE